MAGGIGRFESGKKSRFVKKKIRVKQGKNLAADKFLFDSENKWAHAFVVWIMINKTFSRCKVCVQTSFSHWYKWSTKRFQGRVGWGKHG